MAVGRQGEASSAQSSPSGVSKVRPFCKEEALHSFIQCTQAVYRDRQRSEPMDVTLA
jgi:hypothetical protein